MSASDSCPPGVQGDREFCTTHWSVVLAAANQSVVGAQSAWERLCRDDWYPRYAYLRRTGHCPHDAQDLTQGFLLSLTEKGDLQAAAPERGRFRSFLLGTLKHFLADERKKARAQKRGGGHTLVSLDAEGAESRTYAR